MSHFNAIPARPPMFRPDERRPGPFRPALPTVTFDSFKQAFGMAQATELNVTDAERSMLADLVSRMDVGGQTQALEHALVRGDPATFRALARSAPRASLSFQAFRDGVQMAAARELSLNAEELSALSHAFRRLPFDAQRSALSFLQERNYTELYQACADRAPYVPMTFDSFQQAVNMAAATELRITEPEQQQLVDSFGRLDFGGQSQALEFLLARNHTDTYAAAAASSGMGRMSLKGFLDGLNMAAATELRITPKELGTLVDAFQRLDRGEQQQALDTLAKRNLSELYAACASARW